jgi:hypothetical protein
MNIKELNEHLLRLKKAKYSHWPLEAQETLSCKKQSDKSANALEEAICIFLTSEGHQAERIKNMGRYIDDSVIVENVMGQQKKIGSGKFIPGTGTAGTADIHAKIKPTVLRFAIPVMIEVKFGNDRQSEVQKKYQAKTEASGAIYIIVKTFEDFHSKYLGIMQLS